MHSGSLRKYFDRTITYEHTLPSTLNWTVNCITMETTTKRNGYSKLVWKKGKSEVHCSSKTERKGDRGRGQNDREEFMPKG